MLLSISTEQPNLSAVFGLTTWKLKPNTSGDKAATLRSSRFHANSDCTPWDLPPDAPWKVFLEELECVPLPSECTFVKNTLRRLKVPGSASGDPKRGLVSISALWSLTAKLHSFCFSKGPIQAMVAFAAHSSRVCALLITIIQPPTPALSAFLLVLHCWTQFWKSDGRINKTYRHSSLWHIAGIGWSKIHCWYGS